MCTPPDSRVGLRDFAISSLPVGLGFFKIQGGVVIVGWGCFFQGGFDLFSMQKFLSLQMFVSQSSWQQKKLIRANHIMVTERKSLKLMSS